MNRPEHSQPTPARRPRGAALIVVLVCLIAFSTILLGTIGISLRHRQQLRTELQVEQTHWLLDAGIGQAVRRLSDNPEAGDLELTLDQPVHGRIGKVEIKILEVSPTEVQFKVTATLATEHKNPVTTKRSKTLSFIRTDGWVPDLPSDK